MGYIKRKSALKRRFATPQTTGRAQRSSSARRSSAVRPTWGSRSSSPSTTRISSSVSRAGKLCGLAERFARIRAVNAVTAGTSLPYPRRRLTATTKCITLNSGFL